MARKKEEPAELAGTVEEQRLAFFEREKAGYEARTGETVDYVPGVPLTRTPIEAVQEGAAAAGGDEVSE